MHQFGGDRWYDEQSAPGKLLKGTPPQEYTSGESGSNSGLSDSGLLSVDDSINQFIDYTWYGELEKYLFNSQSARNPRFSLVDGHDLNNILSTYIWGPEGAWGRDGPTVLGAQNEIFSSLAKASSDLTSQSPWRGPISSTSGEIVISIDNSTGLDDQIYLKQFIISALINIGLYMRYIHLDSTSIIWIVVLNHYTQIHTIIFVHDAAPFFMPRPPGDVVYSLGESSNTGIWPKANSCIPHGYQ